MPKSKDKKRTCFRCGHQEGEPSIGCSTWGKHWKRHWYPKREFNQQEK